MADAKVEVVLGEGSVWDAAENKPAELFAIPVRMRVDGIRTPCVLAIRNDHDKENIVEVHSFMDTQAAQEQIRDWEEEGYEAGDCYMASMDVTYHQKYLPVRTAEDRLHEQEREQRKADNRDHFSSIE